MNSVSIKSGRTVLLGEMSRKTTLTQSKQEKIVQYKPDAYIYFYDKMTMTNPVYRQVQKTIQFRVWERRPRRVFFWDVTGCEHEMYF